MKMKKTVILLSGLLLLVSTQAFASPAEEIRILRLTNAVELQSQGTKSDPYLYGSALCRKEMIDTYDSEEGTEEERFEAAEDAFDACMDKRAWEQESAGE